jgi:hypothetical protein
MFGEWFREYLRDRRRSKSWSEAYDLARAGKYAEAADIYAGRAAESLKYNELIYASDCQDAFKMWIKAKNVERALEEARNALRVLSDTGWLSKSDDSVEKLSGLAGELYVAGYAAEAESFLREINEQLAAHGLPHASAPEGAKLPTACPHCGGLLSPPRGETEVTCSYCGSVIRAA